MPRKGNSVHSTKSLTRANTRQGKTYGPYKGKDKYRLGLSISVSGSTLDDLDEFIIGSAIEFEALSDKEKDEIRRETLRSVLYPMLATRLRLGNVPEGGSVAMLNINPEIVQLLDDYLIETQGVTVPGALEQARQEALQRFYSQVNPDIELLLRKRLEISRNNL